MYIYIGNEQHTNKLQLYSVKGKINYVNTPTDVLKEFRDGAITTSSGRQFQVCTESGTKECWNDVVRQKAVVTKRTLGNGKDWCLGLQFQEGSSKCY